VKKHIAEVSIGIKGNGERPQQPSDQSENLSSHPIKRLTVLNVSYNG
jgi:hypothetical protein